MPSNKTPKGFDTFFQSIIHSPEFREFTHAKESIKDLKDLEKSLISMQADVERASSMMKNLDASIAFSGDKENHEEGIPKNGTLGIQSSTPPKTGSATDELGIKVEVQRFQKKEGKPFGFEAVAGMDELKKELQESFIKPLKFKFLVERLKKANTENPQGEEEKKRYNLVLRLYSEYEKFKVSIPTGMLLYGPPGTGKTFITKKLAEELGCGFISKNMGEFGSSYLHQTTKNIRDFFFEAKKASENEPIILFLDEIDSLVSARTHNVDANKAEEVSQFLQEFNSLEEAPNLIVIAATNRPDHLDPAILRSGRLDKKIYLGPPDEHARRELFRMYIEKIGRPSHNLDYARLATLTEGYVSADIEAICDEVARDISQNLLELVDEAENGTLTEDHLDDHIITMKSIEDTIASMPSSLKMVDMSIYENWLQKIA